MFLNIPQSAGISNSPIYIRTNIVWVVLWVVLVYYRPLVYKDNYIWIIQSNRRTDVSGLLVVNKNK